MIKEYYVDFSCMIVNAESSEEAEKIVRRHLKFFGLSPEICSIEESGDKQPKEIGGRGGLDPSRYGDWEKDGRCIDF